MVLYGLSKEEFTLNLYQKIIISNLFQKIKIRYKFLYFSSYLNLFQKIKIRYKFLHFSSYLNLFKYFENV